MLSLSTRARSFDEYGFMIANIHSCCSSGFTGEHVAEPDAT
nr:MAG TPA: hypothetical protein [Caudoviricetes sp.]